MAEYIASERCDFSCGDRIDKKYRVEKVLGEGTFGRVYCVRGDDGQLYALKLLKLWEVLSSERPKLVRRFDMEYETGRIPSHYLVSSVSKGSVKNNPFIVMEFCSGGDLLSYMDRGAVDIAKVASEILYGLRDLHKCGKVHRDLKPENVLLKGDGTAVLTDFGISGDQNNRLTEKGIGGVPKQLFGTFGYMPPEQVNPKRGNATVLPTTDIFSFGVLLYQMITGELPFGRLCSEADLPSYVENGRRGLWNRGRLSSSYGGSQWASLIEGCLVPDFKSRIQTADDALCMVPASCTGGAGKYRSVHSDITGPQMSIVNGVQLRVMQGEEAGAIYKLDRMLGRSRYVLNLGRMASDVHNQIAIKEMDSCFISRCHCTLEKNPENRAWIIRDGQWRMDCPIAMRSQEPVPCNTCTAVCHRHGAPGWKRSMNGTYVNSNEVDESGMYILPGDIITVGDVKLRVEGY